MMLFYPWDFLLPEWIHVSLTSSIFITALPPTRTETSLTIIIADRNTKINGYSLLKARPRSPAIRKGYKPYDFGCNIPFRIAEILLTYLSNSAKMMKCRIRDK